MRAVRLCVPPLPPRCHGRRPRRPSSAAAALDPLGASRIGVGCSSESSTGTRRPTGGIKAADGYRQPPAVFQWPSRALVSCHGPFVPSGSSRHGQVARGSGMSMASTLLQHLVCRPRNALLQQEQLCGHRPVNTHELTFRVGHPYPGVCVLSARSSSHSPAFAPSYTALTHCTLPRWPKTDTTSTWS